ncbi:Protein of unknown function [Pyronema omphalodes CBS 100304]|uniref:Uncharacterized protein n=1 Tax=Pyronema omphalodes (strain CBS 100304) TaxID=1076935 RepID=U4LF36_PYROM|nr:Protein of unknown function [Pyronema omphalodes CBS 100304]
MDACNVNFTYYSVAFARLMRNNQPAFHLLTTSRITKTRIARQIKKTTHPTQ